MKVATAALLFREIRERVPLCEDLVGEIVRLRDASVSGTPMIRRRGRGRAVRPV